MKIDIPNDKIVPKQGIPDDYFVKASDDFFTQQKTGLVNGIVALVSKVYKNNVDVVKKVDLDLVKLSKLNDNDLDKQLLILEKQREKEQKKLKDGILYGLGEEAVSGIAGTIRSILPGFLGGGMISDWMTKGYERKFSKEARLERRAKFEEEKESVLESEAPKKSKAKSWWDNATAKFEKMTPSFAAYPEEGGAGMEAEAPFATSMSGDILLKLDNVQGIIDTKTEKIGDYLIEIGSVLYDIRSILTNNTNLLKGVNESGFQAIDLTKEQIEQNEYLSDSLEAQKEMSDTSFKNIVSGGAGLAGADGLINFSEAQAEKAGDGGFISKYLGARFAEHIAKPLLGLFKGVFAKIGLAAVSLFSGLGSLIGSAFASIGAVLAGVTAPIWGIIAAIAAAVAVLGYFGVKKYKEYSLSKQKEKNPTLYNEKISERAEKSYVDLNDKEKDEALAEIDATTGERKKGFFGRVGNVFKKDWQRQLEKDTNKKIIENIKEERAYVSSVVPDTVNRDYAADIMMEKSFNNKMKTVKTMSEPPRLEDMKAIEKTYNSNMSVINNISQSDPRLYEQPFNIRVTEGF